jgi:hypothetical protein
MTEYYMNGVRIVLAEPDQAPEHATVVKLQDGWLKNA